MKTIYLDNSATTKPSAAVIAAMTDALENGWYNPSALYRPAMDAEKAVKLQQELTNIGIRSQVIRSGSPVTERKRKKFFQRLLSSEV